MAATHCPYCALQCGMDLAPGAAGVEVAGRDFPTNRGGLCRKGWTSAAVLGAPDRVTEPLIADGRGGFAAASWDTALDLIAERLITLRSEHGPDANGVFGGGGLTNEKAYLLGKFARLALGTAMIDYNGRFCMSSAAAAANRGLGLDRGLPFPVTDLDQAGQLLLLGSNVADTMPPFVQHLDGIRAGGGLIVVDPRRSATADLTADGGGLHLQPVPGTDLALLLGMIRIAIAEDLVDHDYLAERTEGFAALARSVAGWHPARTQTVTGVPATLIRQAVRLLASRAGSYVITGRGVEQHTDGTDTATAAINLALVLGLVGRPGSGYGTLTGQGNGQGGREHGQKADQLPGYRMITDPAARAAVAKVWGVPADRLPGPGLPAVRLLASIGEPGGIRSLLVHGSNPVVSAPRSLAVAERLRALDFLVVSDFVLSETARLADVVLPVTQWAEEDGTLTNLEGRVIRRRAAVPPPAGVRSELWILTELARRLGETSGFSADPETVFDELRRASAGGRADYSGISYARLDDGEECYWPYPEGGRSTPRPFADGFPTPNGRATLITVEYRGPADRLHRRGELVLITGRLLEHYQSGAQTRRVPELATARPEAMLEIHPATAAALGIGDGDRVRLRNDRGECQVRAAYSRAIRRDTVFLPFHFPDRQRANLLTTEATDPVSGMPEFKVASVRVERITADDPAEFEPVEVGE